MENKKNPPGKGGEETREAAEVRQLKSMRGLIV